MNNNIPPAPFSVSHQDKKDKERKKPGSGKKKEAKTDKGRTDFLVLFICENFILKKFKFNFLARVSLALSVQYSKMIYSPKLLFPIIMLFHHQFIISI